MNNNEYILNEKSAPDSYDFLKRVLELGTSFVEGSIRNYKPLTYKTDDDLIQIISENLPLYGSTYNELLNELKEKVVPLSIAQNDPKYMAFPDVGNSIAGYAADILSSFLNQNLIAVDKSAPIATFIEIQLILWLRELIGYKSYKLHELPNLANLGGVWTSGGSMSNHIAIVTALMNKFPKIKEKGLMSLNKRPGIILAKGVEHFSFTNAAQVLGLGSDSLIWTKTSDDYTTDVDSIEETLQSLDENIEPFMIVAVAGNSRTTNIDNISMIKKLCKEYGIWLHVDACHGGSLLFSDKYKHLVEGIELADSISLDPHKGLFVSYPSSYILFKDPNSLMCFARHPQKITDNKYFDIGMITPFYGSRGFDSLKLWMMIKHMGKSGIGNLIDVRQENFERMVTHVKSMKYFIFLNDPHFYRAAFVFCPEKVFEYINFIKNYHSGFEREIKMIINKYTTLFNEELYKKGEVIFDMATLEDVSNRLGMGFHTYKTIGICVGTTNLEEENIERIEASINHIAKPLLQNMLMELQKNKLYKSATHEELTHMEIRESPASW